MMNERIRELADRAGEYADFESGLCTDEFLKKFAELIVMECCNLFVELRTRPADLAVKDVKRHFGVEE